MENKAKTAYERQFVTKVVRSSLIVCAMLFFLAQILMINQDEVRYLGAKAFSAVGNYVKAIDIAEDITDDEMRDKICYYIAGDMQSDSQFEYAAKIFAELGEYSDSPERYIQCNYGMAVQMQENGDLEGALAAFVLLGNYSDSVERQRDVTYEIAVMLYESGEYSDAVVKFVSLGKYKDSSEFAYKSALAITGDEDAAMAIISSGGVSSEEMEMTLRITERRSVISGNAIAAGAKHTVLRRADGTVSACGDNSKGQCNVNSWKDIIEIRTGAYHTVGLKKDGTVVAVGDNSKGQCDVSEWRNVVSIAVGDSDTIGLTADGTVLCAGYHDYSDIQRAKGIRGVYAGSYALVVQNESGAIIASHKSGGFISDRILNDIAVNTGYYAAIQTGGKCISSLEEAAEWRNIAYIDGGPNGVVAADVDGMVHSLFFRKADKIDFSALKDICQCAAGTGHYVFLAANGMVYAFGDNTYGQCDVASLGGY